MKPFLALLAALVLAGCTTFQKQDACVAAQTAYSVYLAVINADGKPSQDQIVAAQAAAAVLQSQCGWTPPEAQKGMRAKPGVRVDGNMVPIILPPK
jgi:outer membrane murein-binding lipoprotein Lpp